MSACYCCQTRRVEDRKRCTCVRETCRRHAPLCREHCDCGPRDEDPYDGLDDPLGPFGDLPPLREPG